VLVLALVAPAAGRDLDGGTINIMRPEPHVERTKHVRKHAVHRRARQSKGYGVKEQTRRGSSGAVYPTPLPGPQKPLPVPHQQVVTPEPRTPPPIYVPESGRALSNLPTLVPSGPQGTETYQDRAARCAHQAGVYGSAAGDRNAYIGTCVNQ